MSKIYEAFVYMAIGAGAYLVAADVGGPDGVALAATGGNCPSGDCCQPTNNFDCCNPKNNCYCQGYEDEEICVTKDGGFYYGECSGKTCP